MAAHVNLNDKVLKYERFVEEVLKEDLRKIVDQRDQVHAQVAEYLQTKNAIEMLQESKPEGPLHTKVDLGCNFYCQAKIMNASMIVVKVGLGFYVEFTLTEAIRFIDKKCAQLTSEADTLTRDAANIKARIKFVLEGLREVQGISDEPADTRTRDIF